MLGWMPAYLTSIGANATSTGLITSVILWVGTLSLIFLTKLSTKLGMRKPFLWAPSILLIIASWLVLRVNISTSWWLMALIGATAAIRFGTILALPVEIVGPAQAGSASGMVMAVGYIGALIGSLVSGIIIDSTHSYDWVFWGLSIVSAITVIPAFLMPETGSKSKV